LLIIIIIIIIFIYLFIYVILKSYPKYTIDRDIADNADKNRKKTSRKHTGHM